MATFIDLATDIVTDVVTLMAAINGNQHGILQGTHEAVLAEAQGAQIGPDGFNHLRDLQATLRNVTLVENRLNNTLNSLAGVQRTLGAQVRTVLNPLLQQSSSYRAAMTQTEAMAAELAQNNGQRLSGVMFGQGGSGPEVGRSVQSLISTQMQQRSQELASRGIAEPARLIPSARTAGPQVMNAIRQLPITIREASDKLVTIIAAVRALLTQAARQALTGGNAVLAQALNSVERALVAASSRLVAAASRLSTPIIVLNIRELKRQMGIIDEDDGA